MALGRKTGGRVAGTPNKATADVRALAQAYAPAAIAALARLAGLTDEPGAANEATRVAAMRELLDRAHGRPAQAIDLGGDANSLTWQHLVAATAFSNQLTAERLAAENVTPALVIEALVAVGGTNGASVVNLYEPARE